MSEPAKARRHTTARRPSKARKPPGVPLEEHEVRGIGNRLAGVREQDARAREAENRYLVERSILDMAKESYAAFARQIAAAHDLPEQFEVDFDAGVARPIEVEDTP